MDRGSHLCGVGRAWQGGGEARRGRSGGLNLSCIFSWVLMPIGVVARQELIQHEAGGKDIGSGGRNRAAHKMLGRAIVVAADVSLEPVPGRTLVSEEREIHIDELELVAHSDGGICNQISVCGF